MTRQRHSFSIVQCALCIAISAHGAEIAATATNAIAVDSREGEVRAVAPEDIGYSPFWGGVTNGDAYVVIEKIVHPGMFNAATSPVVTNAPGAEGDYSYAPGVGDASCVRLVHRVYDAGGTEIGTPLERDVAFGFATAATAGTAADSRDDLLQREAALGKVVGLTYDTSWATNAVFVAISALPDWGAHHIDILQWALGTELGGPVAIENVTSDIATTADEVFNWPCLFSFDIVYADGFRATVGDAKTIGFNGLKFHAPKGDLFVTRGKLEKPAHLASWKEDDLLPTEKHLHKSRGTHESDFVDAIFDRSWKTACPCEAGHRSITISHLANSCIRTGVKSIKWDAARETSDNAAVNARADIKRHNGWELN